MEKLEWSVAQTSFLIDLIKARPVLWQTNGSTPKNREEAWTDVVEKLNSKFRTNDTQRRFCHGDVRKKWANLRKQTRVQHRKKGQKCTWFYYKKMHFVLSLGEAAKDRSDSNYDDQEEVGQALPKIIKITGNHSENASGVAAFNSTVESNEDTNEEDLTFINFLNSQLKKLNKRTKDEVQKKILHVVWNSS